MLIIKKALENELFIINRMLLQIYCLLKELHILKYVLIHYYKFLFQFVEFLFL